jgi:hypothetical protein
VLLALIVLAGKINEANRHPRHATITYTHPVDTSTPPGYRDGTAVIIRQTPTFGAKSVSNRSRLGRQSYSGRQHVAIFAIGKMLGDSILSWNSKTMPSSTEGS